MLVRASSRGGVGVNEWDAEGEFERVLHDERCLEVIHPAEFTVFDPLTMIVRASDNGEAFPSKGTWTITWRFLPRFTPVIRLGWKAATG